MSREWKKLVAQRFSMAENSTKPAKTGYTPMITDWRCKQRQAEEELLKKYRKKQQEKQAKFDAMEAEEMRAIKQHNQQVIDDTNRQFFLRNYDVRKIHNDLLPRHIQFENEEMVKVKKANQEMEKEKEMRYGEMVRLQAEEEQRQRPKLYQLDYTHLQAMEEKEQERCMELQMATEEREREEAQYIEDMKEEALKKKERQGLLMVEQQQDIAEKQLSKQREEEQETQEDLRVFRQTIHQKINQELFKKEEEEDLVRQFNSAVVCHQRSVMNEEEAAAERRREEEWAAAERARYNEEKKKRVDKLRKIAEIKQKTSVDLKRQMTEKQQREQTQRQTEEIFFQNNVRADALHYREVSQRARAARKKDTKILDQNMELMEIRRGLEEDQNMEGRFFDRKIGEYYAWEERESQKYRRDLLGALGTTRFPNSIYQKKDINKPNPCLGVERLTLPPITHLTPAHKVSVPSETEAAFRCVCSPATKTRLPPIISATHLKLSSTSPQDGLTFLPSSLPGRRHFPTTSAKLPYLSASKQPASAAHKPPQRSSATASGTRHPATPAGPRRAPYWTAAWQPMCAD